MDLVYKEDGDQHPNRVSQSIEYTVSILYSDNICKTERTKYF